MAVQRTLSVSVLFLTGALAGCMQSAPSPEDLAVLAPAAPSEEAPLQSTQEAVIGGTITTDRPEIGWLTIPVGGGYVSGCTATLVAPDILVTASHCVDYRSSTTGAGVTFTVTQASGRTSDYDVDRYVAFSTSGSIGADDVALMHLSSAVPTSLATPARLAETMPVRGTRLTIWGYGCTTRGDDVDGNKRRYSFSQGSGTNNLCPGDSGGPVMTDDGQVVYINSGYWTRRWGSTVEQSDDFGEVPTNIDRLSAQMDAWGATSDDGGGGDEGGTEDTCAGFASDYTCTDRLHFSRCRAGGPVETLVCPDGYGCTVGSTELYCYWGR